MRLLLPPDNLSGDDLETWRRHPVTLWLADQLVDEINTRLRWRSITPETINSLYGYQGRAAVLDELISFVKGDRK